MDRVVETCRVLLESKLKRAYWRLGLLLVEASKDPKMSTSSALPTKSRSRVPEDFSVLIDSSQRQHGNLPLGLSLIIGKNR
jgi:hypothetical protein